MRRFRVGLWFVCTVCGPLVLCISVAAASANTAHASAQGKTLQICIPQEIDPGKLTLLRGTYGNGLSLSQLDTKKGVREYEIDLRDATSVRLLIYCPGYRMVTTDIDVTQVSGSETFSPQFVELPMVPLRVRLVDTKGRPVVGEEVLLRHTLLEMKYFSYLDGRVHLVVVATATTDADGEIEVEVPSLSEDPYFSHGDERWPIGFEVRFPRSRTGIYGCDFVPRVIPAQASYPNPVAVKLVYRGMISGRVTDSFVRRALAEAPVDEGPTTTSYSVTVMARPRGESHATGRRVAVDGTFSMKLPTGSYELSAEIRRDGGETLRQVRIDEGFALGEKEHRVLTLE
jgi:hypothetical protein